MAWSFVGAGTGLTGSNASPLTPSLHASTQAGDQIFILASAPTGRTLSVTGYSTVWTDDTGGSVMYLLGKTAGASESAPSVQFSGGTTTITAQCATFRGGTLTVHATGADAQGTAANISFPSRTITENDTLVLIMGIKRSGGWTSADNVSGFTEIGEATNGTAGHVWNYVIQTTAASITGATWTINGASSASYQGQTLSISVSNVVAPSFTSGPSVTATSDEGNTVSYTPNLGGDTDVDAYLGVYVKDSATPSAANVKAGAGTGFIALFSELGVTGADTLISTGLDFPIHDYHMVLENSAGLSSVSSLTDVAKDPPAGKVYLTFASVDTDTIYDDFTPAVVAGDIREADATISPSGETPTDNTDGSVEFVAEGRQSRVERIYDVSVGDWMEFGAGDSYTQFWNALPPDFVDPYSSPIELSDLEDIEITALDYNDAIQSPHGDDLTFSLESGTRPTGIGFSSETESGTPTTPGISRYTARATDLAALTLDADFIRIIRPARPIVVGEPDDLDLTVGSSVNEDLSTAFGHEASDSMTYELLVPGTPGGSPVTQANGAGTQSQAMTVDDASGIDVGDYVNGVLVLAKYSNTLELATPTSWADNEDIYVATPTAADIDGLSFSSAGALTGTPETVGDHTVFVRATDSNSRIKDTVTLTVSLGEAIAGALPDSHFGSRRLRRYLGVRV